MPLAPVSSFLREWLPPQSYPLIYPRARMSAIGADKISADTSVQCRVFNMGQDYKQGQEKFYPAYAMKDWGTIMGVNWGPGFGGGLTKVIRDNVFKIEYEWLAPLIIGDLVLASWNPEDEGLPRDDYDDGVRFLGKVEGITAGGLVDVSWVDSSSSRTKFPPSDLILVEGYVGRTPEHLLDYYHFTTESRRKRVRMPVAKAASKPVVQVKSRKPMMQVNGIRRDPVRR